MPVLDELYMCILYGLSMHPLTFSRTQRAQGACVYEGMC